MNIHLLLRIGLAALIAFTLMSAFGQRARTSAPVTVTYSEFLAAVSAGDVSRVSITGERVVGQRRGGEPFTTFVPNDPGLIGDLLDAGVTVSAQAEPEPSLLGRTLVTLLPLLLLVGVWIYFMRRQLGAGGALGFGRSRARARGGDDVDVRLADVAGIDEVKEEVGEVVEFLRDPSRISRLGGTIPRGVLLVGPPGTGKTLLARAIAGEAGVPFFTVSGSDFVEMFAGVGASRVRDLFVKAKERAPCIVFVDEVDAVGRRRGAGMGGGHDEREQTLNQMLVEMDGFEGNEGVIVIAATNRPDVLDPALLRPGRFDRQLTVPLPDIVGRAQILRLHMRKVPLADDVDAHLIARGTPGFSGADLANLVNEAALLTARSSRDVVDMDAFESAKDKMLMGAERRSTVMSEQERRLTAYHEAGHAIVGRRVPEHDPVHKVSIIPRGRALGVTVFLPDGDRHSASRRRLESEISTLLGGRVAEELVFGKDAVTTGAANDIERATRIAHDMVVRYGLSELGPLALDDEQGELFLGRPVRQPRTVSEATATRIDREVRRIVDGSHARARVILESHRDVLDAMADALVDHETLDSGQIETLLAGGVLARPEDAGHGRRGPPAQGTPSVPSSPAVRPAVARNRDPDPVNGARARAPRGAENGHVGSATGGI